MNNLQKFFHRKVNSLNRYQTRGVSQYELTREQVQTPNFGLHTLTAMDALKTRNRDLSNQAAFAGVSPVNGLSNQDAFAMVKGLNETQAIGVSDYQLLRNQVQTPNFGWDILSAIDILKRQNCAPDNQAAFAMVEGLNRNQIRGVIFRQLSEEHAVNFGENRLRGGLNSPINRVRENGLREDRGINPRSQKRTR